MRRSPVRDVRDDLLAADDENHVAGTGHERTKLAPTRGRDQDRAFLGHRVRASDDEVRRGGEVAHLARLHLTVHLVEPRTKRLVQARSFDVLGDADRFECARGVVEHLRADRKDRTHRVPGWFAGVDDEAGDPVAFQRGRRRDRFARRMPILRTPQTAASVGPSIPPSCITRHPVPPDGGVPTRRPSILHRSPPNNA